MLGRPAPEPSAEVAVGRGSLPERSVPAASQGDLPDEPRAPPPGSFLVDEAHAREEALRQARPMLVVFAADWCVPCRLIEADALSDPRVRDRLATEFIALHVDVTEETRETRELLARYRVRGVPALLLLDAEGRELERVEGYLDADALLERLTRARARPSG